MSFRHYLFISYVDQVISNQFEEKTVVLNPSNIIFNLKKKSNLLFV